MACRLGVYPSMKLVIFGPDDGLSSRSIPINEAGYLRSR